MKKIAIIVLLIFSTIVCSRANGLNSGKTTSTDSISRLTKYERRHTLEGYKAFYEIEYGFDIDDMEINREGNRIPGYPHCNNLFISTTQGYQFNNFIFVGAQVGVLRYLDAKTTLMPITLALRINLLNDKKVTPFIQANLGGVVGKWGGMYIDFRAGVRIRTSKKHALTCSVGWIDHMDFSDWLNDSDDDDEGICWGASYIGLRLGYEF